MATPRAIPGQQDAPSRVVRQVEPFRGAGYYRHAHGLRAARCTPLRFRISRDVPMNFAQLLTALSMEIRLDLQAAVAAGGCTIQFDRNVELVLEAEADTGQVQLYVVVAEPPAANRE